MRTAFSLIIYLFLSIIVMGGCGGGSSGGLDEDSPSQPPQAGLYKNNLITVDDIQRTYDYYIPSGLGSQAAPLVILLHGHLGNTDSMTGENGLPAPFKVWMQIAEEDKLILIFPEGVVRPNDETGWNDCRGDTTTTPSTDDVGFIAAMIQQFRSSFSIDANRIYASGTSNGGFMSLRLALELSDQIAAVGVNAAGMPAISKCAGAVRLTSVLFMRGTADPIVPYLGGTIGNPNDGRGSVQSASDSVQYWTTFNQTSTTANITDFADIDTSDNSTVQRYRHTGGLEQTEVVLYEITGGGHGAPSIQEQYSLLYELIIGRQNHDIEMAREVWGFFRDKCL